MEVPSLWRGNLRNKNTLCPGMLCAAISIRERKRTGRKKIGKRESACMTSIKKCTEVHDDAPHRDCHPAHKVDQGCPVQWRSIPHHPVSIHA